MPFGSTAILTVSVGTVQQEPPGLTGIAIGSHDLVQGAGTQVIETAAAFSGSALTYSLLAAPSAVMIDTSTGRITVGKSALLPATTIEVQADNETGDPVTASFRLQVRAASTLPDPTAFQDQDLVIGRAVSIDVAASFAGDNPAGALRFTLDPASVDDPGFPAGLDLPLGLSLDPVSGKITGTPCQLTPPMRVTVRASDGKGYARTARASFGVSPKPGVPAPSKFVWTALPSALEAVFGWTTRQTISTSLNDLEAAIQSAARDAGTPNRPKCHQITYTGPGGDEIEVNGGSFQNGSIVHILCADQKIKECKVLKIRAVVENASFFGGLTPARAVKPGNTAMLLGCRIGGLFGDDVKVIAAGAVDGSYEDGCCLWGCHIAGGENGPTMKTGRMALIECLGTHFAIDGMRGYYGIGTQPFIYMYTVGNVFTHFAGYRTRAHGDLYQDGGGLDVTTENYENVWMVSNTRYGTTGWRSQAENAPRLSDGGVDDARMNVTHVLKQNVMGITGIHLLAGNRVKWDVDGLFGLPHPNAGARGLARSLNEPRPEISISNWFMAGTDAAGIRERCPNVTGADVAHNFRLGSDKRGDLFISDLPRATFHPQAWRDYVSTVWRPAAGWAAEGLTDPADYGGIFDWGAPPAWKEIVLRDVSGSVSGSGCSGRVTLPRGISGGLLWISVTPSAESPRWPQLLDGVDLDGTAGGVQAKPFFHPSSTNAYYGAVRITGDGVQDFSFNQSAFSAGKTYYIHVGYEHVDGSLSNVITSSATRY